MVSIPIPIVIEKPLTGPEPIKNSMIAAINVVTFASKIVVLDLVYPGSKAIKLFLVGFMATGKTTIGKRLSSKLNLPFFDSDKEIELNLGCSIKEYFNIHGEDEFRMIEKKMEVLG